MRLVDYVPRPLQELVPADLVHSPADLLQVLQHHGAEHRHLLTYRPPLQEPEHRLLGTVGDLELPLVGKLHPRVRLDVYAHDLRILPGDEVQVPIGTVRSGIDLHDGPRTDSEPDDPDAVGYPSVGHGIGRFRRLPAENPAQDLRRPPVALNYRDILRPDRADRIPMILHLQREIDHDLRDVVGVPVLLVRQRIHLAVLVLRRSGHPLDVPEPEPPLDALGVVVVDVALLRQRDRLVPPVGVHGESGHDLPVVHPESEPELVVPAQVPPAYLLQRRGLLVVAVGVVVLVVRDEEERILRVPMHPETGDLERLR